VVGTRRRARRVRGDTVAASYRRHISRDNTFPATQFTVSNQKQIAARTGRACVRLTNAPAAEGIPPPSPPPPRLRKIMTSARRRRVWVTSSFRDGRSRFTLARGKTGTV
jgi:hypothetical protein